MADPDDIFAKPLRKPGYISPRERAVAERKLMSQQLIAALEEARAARENRDSTAISSNSRAKNAYEKLQYDFPVCQSSHLPHLACMHTPFTNRSSPSISFARPPSLSKTSTDVPLQLVSADEVHALVKYLGGRLDAGRNVPLALTGKLVENAVEGAAKLAGAPRLASECIKYQCHMSVSVSNM